MLFFCFAQPRDFVGGAIKLRGSWRIIFPPPHAKHMLTCVLTIRSGDLQSARGGHRAGQVFTESHDLVWFQSGCSRSGVRRSRDQNESFAFCVVQACLDYCLYLLLETSTVCLHSKLMSFLLRLFSNKLDGFLVLRASGSASSHIQMEWLSSTRDNNFPLPNKR